MKKWIALKLVKIAWKLYPESQEVKKFYTDIAMDMVVTGNSITKINHQDTITPSRPPHTDIGI